MIIPKKQIEFKVIFSPAVGGRRNEVTTSNIVRRHGRIIAALARKQNYDKGREKINFVLITCKTATSC